ncbi:MAG: hypothetical protein A2977_03535 [Alphaproteobacteria bacterium RIFCSPLOWO2_01_FULL_45_8]|nr:MAG: hypothetical protein A2977_03535 [Alphaproteobacteria bacterium RIFCSPLOWO2_01_FULL_45_8]
MHRAGGIIPHIKLTTRLGKGKLPLCKTLMEGCPQEVSILRAYLKKEDPQCQQKKKTEKTNSSDHDLYLGSNLQEKRSLFKEF